MSRLTNRLLFAALLGGVLAPLSGCHLLQMLSVRPENNQPKVDPVKIAAGEPSPGSLPTRYQFRLSQYLILSDFEVKKDLPLFKELVDLREQIQKTLQLPNSTSLIQVCLFEDRDRYERFMEAKYPDLPKRRAFFVAQPRAIGGEEMLVFTYWGNGDRIQQDLRHECTHALLHSVLRDVPLWLDEGLAEYFELPPGKGGVNNEHLTNLRRGPTGPARIDLARLEQLTQVEQMTPAEYREAWAWVHFMMHTSDESRKVLTGYLKDLRSTKSPGQIRNRLTTLFPTPEVALERHLSRVELQRRPGMMAN